MTAAPASRKLSCSPSSPTHPSIRRLSAATFAMAARLNAPPTRMTPPPLRGAGLPGQRLDGTAAELVRLVVGGQAATGRQVELPAVHGAGERVPVDLAEAAEVSAQMRAAALHDPLAELDVFLVVILVGVPAFGV